jgi:DNA repair photolyase
MNLQEIESKSIFSKTGIPVADYVANPYVGCSHGCIYCYARFMKRFTGHHEKWGEFLDVKINTPNLVPKTDRYEGKSIFLSSVTDPYLPQERDYQLTRKIIQNMIPLNPFLNILTKSDLVLRDLNLLKQFEVCEIGFSFSTFDENLKREIEPRAKPVKNRLKALKKVHNEGIQNYIFISPIMPFITDWESIISQTHDFVDYFMFENLNVNGSVWSSVKQWLEHNHPELLPEYKHIYFEDNNYWKIVEDEIKAYCQVKGLKNRIYFHH